MGTEDSTVINVASASSTIAILSKFDIVAIRRDFERLSVDDLKVLASFPVEPHELIGRVVAVTHCLLLSLAPEHTTLELRAPQWPLLRLQLLENATKIWRKLRKRAWQLETGVKSLSPVQVRFGCTELVPFILPIKHEKQRYPGSWQLERLAQVSTIAASLGAWAVFCLCWSELPSLRLHKVSSTKLSSGYQNSSPSTTSAASKLEPIITRNQVPRGSRRVGTKIGGRFLLYHVRFPVYSNSHGSVSVETLGEWSVYCLETNRIGRQPHTASASWWKPPHTIRTPCSSKPHPLVLGHLTPLAQQSLLLQLGYHEHIFERPVQNFPYTKASRSFPPVFTLKFDVVTADSQSQLSLRGLGNVWTAMETTVADLRSQVTPLIASRLFTWGDQQLNFHFMYRGSFLSVSHERHLAAVTLLPFTMLVVGDTYQVKEYLKSSQVWSHHCGVAQALVNAGLPGHIAYTQSLQVPGLLTSIPTAPQAYPICQTLTALAAETSTIIEVFTHWQAFVHFQELQDSSVLFQLPQRSPNKQVKSPKHRMIEDQRNVRDESVPFGPQPQPLPRKKFNSKKEWLLPLYAVIDVLSPTTAVLKTPFRQDVEQTLSSPCRLVLGDKANVIHFTRVNCVSTERDSIGVRLAVFNIEFLRDETCPLEALFKLKSVYVWLIVPRKPHNNREIPALPTEWIVDLYQLVQHPTYDFQSQICQQFHHFRVGVSWDVAERVVEAEFWSKDVDWAPLVIFTELYSTILRQIFDTLCRSHPPAFGVDSVKFSKLLYGANIQPKLLSIGDAAFLFASNLTPGLTYEMDFDGFVRAIEWLAHQFYGETGTKSKLSPSKAASGVQHAMMKWKHSGCGEQNALLASLRRFCFETLVHLPSLTSTWYEIMNSWRLARKQQLMQQYALKYCAATRLRATWVGFIAWRIFLQRRQRMKEERLAATKIQSLVRGRKLYLEYQRVRPIVIGIQLRIHARFELRRLRAERAAFIESMRIRIVNWMRRHLWILREWKRSNAKILARRDRIRERRLRRLGVAVFPLETCRVRFSLYCAKPVESKDQATMNEDVENVRENAAEQQGEANEVYELEVVDATRSWGLVFCVSQQQIDQFIAEEIERQAIQLQLGFATVAEKQIPSSEATIMVQNKLPRGRNQIKSVVVRDSVVYPVLKPNAMLLALARRLFILKDVQQVPTGLRCYADPSDTSLGKLLFKGALRSERVDDEELVVQRHVVRVLGWAGTFKFLTYTPASSTRHRYDLDATFILAVLQYTRFQSLRLSPEEEDDVLPAVMEEQSEASTLGISVSDPLHYIHCVMKGSYKLFALQYILSYVLKYGVRKPTYSMMPHVVAERERQREEQEAKQRNAILNRERQLIVKVQTRLRQHLARKARLQLALKSYSKKFDRNSGRFVYVHQLQSGERIVLGKEKPFSLFDQDVPLPPDEWQLVSAAGDTICYLNPRRGAYSRFNDVLAATVIQRWYRGKMWNGINTWNLCDLVNALRYHSNVQKPTKMTDPGELENLKRYALQLHVMEHQYKAAYPVYEAALKLSPNDPQTLVCLATLLVISCRYPATQSWQRAMALLQQARDLIGEDVISMLHEVEQNCFRYALFSQPKNPHAIANYAVFLQCVHLGIDKAELLYRRALDLDPANDLFFTNFQRLQSERAPGRMYAFAGPGTISLARSSEIRRCGSKLQWREMEDPEAQPPAPKRFFHNLRTGKCTWEFPTEDPSMEEAPVKHC